MNILFTHTNYKKYLKQLARDSRGKVTGFYSKLAQASQIQVSNLSTIMAQDKSHLNLDQAALISEYLGHTGLETEYFLTLVSLARAHSAPLKKILQDKIKEIQKKTKTLESKFQSQDSLNELDRGIYYSRWYYQAVQILCAIEGYQDVETLSARLKLPKKTITHVREFLLKTGLCQDKDGLRPGLTNFRLDPESPWRANHLSNWRVRAMERLSEIDTDQEIAYSGNFSISKADAALVRKKCAAFLESLREVVKKSDPEEGYLLNLDWFKI